MFTGWMIAGTIIGAIGVLAVWCVIVAIFLTWYEDRHRHAR
jgi:hypothetical protein